MRPTAEGALLAEEVRRSFSGLNRVAASAEAIRLGVRGRIVVTAIPAYAEGFVARAIGRLVEGAPEVDARIEMDSPQDMMLKVLHDQADLCIMTGSFEGRPEVEVHVLGQRRLTALVRADHPLAGRQEVGVGDLSGHATGRPPRWAVSPSPA